MTFSLFDFEPTPPEVIGAGAVLLRGFAATQAQRWVDEVQSLQAVAPFRVMTRPGGAALSVNMSNCGDWGWVSDESGYRYSAVDTLSGQPWPQMPAFLRDQAIAAAAEAGYPGFAPDACLINLYRPGAKMGLHRDEDEDDMSAPVLSVSLGDTAVFRMGGPERGGKTETIKLSSGDVLVMGGASRLCYHGIDRVLSGTSTLLKDGGRINLTLRRVTKP